MANSLARRALFASASIICLIGRPAAAQASPEAKQFSISAQSAETAIGQIGRQGDVQIIAAHNLIHSVETNAVRGDMTVTDALDKLLAGTGLTARQTSPNTYVIVARTAGAPVTSENVTPALLSTAPQDPPPPAPSAAASPNPEGTEVRAVIVTGLRASLESARGIKESAEGIVDAITLQDIGKLPDANLAESLQRITGVTIDRQGGEGAFVTVRGFGPEFNTVLVNGRQIATPTDPSQASGRAFSFDTLASELVSGVNVYKSSTAVFQSGGVGATVNILTARPFDFKGMKFSGSIDQNYDTNAERGAPDASFLFSDILDGGKLGVLVSGSYQERYTRLNNSGTSGYLVNPQVADPSQINGGAGLVTKPDPQGNLFVAQSFGNAVTREDRQRIGGSIVLQYRPVDNLTVTLDSLYSKLSDNSDTRSYGNWFTASNLTNIKTNAEGNAIDMTQASGIATDFHDAKASTITDTGDYGLNVDWKITPHLTANFDASYSEARELPNLGQESYLALLGYLTGSVRYQVDGNTLPYTTETLPAYPNPGTSCGQTPTNSGVAVTGHTVGAGEQICQHVMLLRGYGTDDQVSQLRADFTWKGDGAEGLVKSNWGLYFSNDRKNTELYSNDGGTGNTTSGYNYPAPPSEQITMYNAGSGFLSGVSGSNRLVTEWPTFGGPQLFSAISAQQRALNPNFTFAPPEVNDTIVTEQVLGGYFESDFRGDLLGRPLSVVAGVRIEDTVTHVNALATAFDALVPLLNDKTQYGVTNSGTTRVTGSNYYLDILPDVSFNWKLAHNFIARLAASQTMTRPTLEDLSPVTTLVTIRPGDFAASSGNPNLKPFRSNNLDVSGEYYYGRTSYVSLGAYVKNVTNFIVLNESTGPVRSTSGGSLIDPGTGQPAAWSISAPVNGPDATVTGLEGAWQQTIFETGFGFQLNGTLVGSNRQLDTMDLNDKFAVTGLSNSFNLIGFYAKNGLEARIAYTWRDHFLQYLAPPPLNGAGQAVTQVAPYGQLDASVTYHLNDRLAVYWEGANLTNSTLLKYAYYTDQFLYAEQDGMHLKMGFRFTY